nr:DMT family transporter [Gammaproteobacteria bacterium]
MTPPISSSVTARSFGLILVAYFLFASLDAVAKWLATEGYEPLFLAWVRFVLHVLVGGVLLQCWKHPGRYTLSRWPLQGFRGLLLAGATISNFVAVGYLRLDQTMTLFLASPFLVALLAGPLLNEWVGLRRWIAIGVGFIGVLVVMRPGTSMFQWPILYAALATVFLSLYFISTRYLHGESSDSLLLY